MKVCDRCKTPLLGDWHRIEIYSTSGGAAEEEREFCEDCYGKYQQLLREWLKGGSKTE